MNGKLHRAIGPEMLLRVAPECISLMALLSNDNASLSYALNALSLGIEDPESYLARLNFEIFLSPTNMTVALDTLNRTRVATYTLMSEMLLKTCNDNAAAFYLLAATAATDKQLVNLRKPTPSCFVNLSVSYDVAWAALSSLIDPAVMEQECRSLMSSLGKVMNVSDPKSTDFERLDTFKGDVLVIKRVCLRFFHVSSVSEAFVGDLVLFFFYYSRLMLIQDRFDQCALSVFPSAEHVPRMEEAFYLLIITSECLLGTRQYKKFVAELGKLPHWDDVLRHDDSKLEDSLIYAQMRKETLLGNMTKALMLSYHLPSNPPEYVVFNSHPHCETALIHIQMNNANAALKILRSHFMNDRSAPLFAKLSSLVAFAAALELSVKSLVQSPNVRQIQTEAIALLTEARILAVDLFGKNSHRAAFISCKLASIYLAISVEDYQVQMQRARQGILFSSNTPEMSIESAHYVLLLGRNSEKRHPELLNVNRALDIAIKATSHNHFSTLPFLRAKAVNTMLLWDHAQGLELLEKTIKLAEMNTGMSLLTIELLVEASEQHIYVSMDFELSEKRLTDCRKRLRSFDHPLLTLRVMVALYRLNYKRLLDLYSLVLQPHNKSGSHKVLDRLEADIVAHFVTHGADAAIYQYLDYNLISAFLDRAGKVSEATKIIKQLTTMCLDKDVYPPCEYESCQSAFSTLISMMEQQGRYKYACKALNEYKEYMRLYDGSDVSEELLERLVRIRKHTECR